MTAKRELLIIGAGGFGRETAALVADLDSFELVGFLDDNPSIVGTEISGVSVVGTVEAARESRAALVVTTGSPSNFRSREAIVDRLELDRGRYVTLMHPSVIVGNDCDIGVGTVIQASCVLTVDVSVGDHVVVMPHTVLTHDDVVGDFATFGAGVLVAGRVSIGDGAYLGSGSRIREDLTIGAGALIGMGSVVLDHVPPDTVWAGVPARQIVN